MPDIPDHRRAAPVRSRLPGPEPRGLTPTLVLALGTFAVGTDAFIVAGFLPAIAEALRVSPQAAGQSITVFAVAYAVLSPVIATVTAHIPRRRLLVGALLVLALANAGSALAPNYSVLMIARVLAAVGAATYTPNAGAVSAALVRPELRARALSVVVGGLTIATALGVPLGSVAAHAMGWRAALGLVAALSLVAAAGVLAIMPVVPGGPRVALRARLAVLRRPGVLTVLPLTVLGMAAGYVPYAYSIPVLAAVGIGPPTTLWMLFLYGIGAVLGNFVSGTATDRWGGVWVLASGYTVMAGALAVLALSAATGVHVLGVTALLMVAWGASSWCQTPPQQHRLMVAAPEETTLVVGLNASAIYAGIGLGTVLGGITLPVGIDVTAGLGATLAVAAGVFLAVTVRRR